MSSFVKVFFSLMILPTLAPPLSPLNSNSLSLITILLHELQTCSSIFSFLSLMEEREKRDRKRKSEIEWQNEKWKTHIHPFQSFPHFSAKFLKDLSKIYLLFLLLSLNNFFTQPTIKIWCLFITLKLLFRRSLTTNLLPVSMPICLYLL